MIEQAIIVAGIGESQLGVLTRGRSRALLPILGKPIIARVIQRLYRIGVRRFVVVLGEHEGEVASYLYRSGPPNAELVFVVWSAGSLGVAAAMAAAFAHLRPKAPFLLAEADILTDSVFLEQLVARFEQASSSIVAALCQTQFGPPGSYWPVRIQGDTITHVVPNGSSAQKQLYGLFPLLACQPDVTPHLAGRFVPFYRLDDIGNVLNAIIAEGRPVKYALADWHGRLSRPADLLALNIRWLDDEGQDAHILSEIHPSVAIQPPVRIDPRVSIGANAQVGPNVYLESGSTVGPRAVVHDCVVLNGGYVVADEVVHDRVVTRYASVL